MKSSLICGIAFLLGLSGAARSDDKVQATTQPQLWPQWRGPQRDGQVIGPAWPGRLSGDSLALLWRVPLGPSYSGPIVSETLVFATETRDAAREVVRALDRKTGEQRWEVSWDGALSVPFFAKANGDWIRATPACDGERLYVAGMRDVLVCLDARTGATRWRVDFVADIRCLRWIRLASSCKTRFPQPI